MINDIYGANIQQVTAGILRAKEMLMSVAGSDMMMVGALIQNVSAQYTRQIQTLREVGSANYYYSEQSPQGVLTFSRLVAPNKKIFDLLPKKTTDNAWQAPQKSGQRNPNITLKSTSTTNKLSYTFHNCLVTSFGASTNAESSYMQEQVTIMFAGFEIN